MPIPKQKANPRNKRIKSNADKLVSSEERKIVFSFEPLEFNEYFNLDGTCVNWSFDLFKILKVVSDIEPKRIRAGEFSREGSPLRIHDHRNATPPCKLPENIAIEDLWQIRISQSKGGIHGILDPDDVFYIVWFDPQHNMYPDERHGGLKKIVPPSSCCKERDEEIEKLYAEIRVLKECNDKLLEDNEKIWEEIAADLEK